MKNFQPSPDLRQTFQTQPGVVQIISWARVSIGELHQLNEGEHDMQFTNDIRGRIKALRALLAGFAPAEPELKATPIPSGSGMNLDNIPYGMSL